MKMHDLIRELREAHDSKIVSHFFTLGWLVAARTTANAWIPHRVSGPGVKLERRPIVGFLEDAVGVQKRKLGSSQSGGGVLSPAQPVI